MPVVRALARNQKRNYRGGVAANTVPRSHPGVPTALLRLKLRVQSGSVTHLLDRPRRIVSLEQRFRTSRALDRGARVRSSRLDWFPWKI